MTKRTSLNLISPLKFSIIISGMTFSFFIFGLLSLWGLSLKDNRTFTEALSQTILRLHLENIRNGEFREFTETLSQEFSNIHLTIQHDRKEIFRFNSYSRMSTCKESTLEGAQKLTIKICRPYHVNFSAGVPLFLFFFLVLAVVISYARKTEERSNLSLQDFMKEAGFKLRARMNFGETLRNLDTLQSEFLVLKQKIAQHAEESTRAKMANYLAHDLRSPLLVFEEVLHIESEKEFSRFKPRLSASINRVQHMINSLNDPSLSETYLTEVCNFELQTVIDEAHLLSRKRNILLKTEVEQGVTYVLDREKVERSVANLLRNAIAHAEHTVMLQMFSTENQLVLRVLDDGPGVPQEIKDLIFEEHFAFGKERGTGLGLSYSREAVNAHGGSLKHYREGEWTVFEVSIPLSRVCEIPESVPNRVLLVLEDGEFQEKLMKHISNEHWIFADEIPSVETLKEFRLVYSDLPTIINLASRHNIRAVVAMNTDTVEKIQTKLSRILGSL